MKTILDVHKIDGTNGNMAQWQKDDTRKKKMTTISKKKMTTISKKIQPQTSLIGIYSHSSFYNQPSTTFSLNQKMITR